MDTCQYRAVKLLQKTSVGLHRVQEVVGQFNDSMKDLFLESKTNIVDPWLLYDSPQSKLYKVHWEKDRKASWSMYVDAHLIDSSYHPIDQSI